MQKMKYIWVAIGVIAGCMLVAFLMRPHGIGESAQPAHTIENRTSPAPPARDIPDVPAPPPDAPSAQQPTSLGASGVELPPDYVPLVYDSALSFSENLQRLREHCAAWPDATEHAEPLAPFVSELLRHAQGQFEVVQAALANGQGSNGFRCILLACLMNCDGPVRETADWVWKVAANEQEWPGVRRTAAFLTSQVADSPAHPVELWSLLNDADVEVVVAALAVAPRHMNRQAFDYISSELTESDNINIQVAAIHSLGSTPYPEEAQARLKDLIGETETSRNDPLSETSLAKRNAVLNLDLADPEAVALVLNLALNPQEEPGVRAKAISRFALKERPEAALWMGNLLEQEVNNPLVFRAVVDALLTDPTPLVLASIWEQVGKMEDPQMRNLILKRIDMQSMNK